MNGSIGSRQKLIIKYFVSTRLRHFDFSYKIIGIERGGIKSRDFNPTGDLLTHAVYKDHSVT